VCYHLHIGSPLTLSEVRAMLPAGISADILPAAELTRMRTVLPAAQTAARLRVGPCSCDLVRSRQRGSRTDERELRRRYARLGLTRERIIQALERHRRDPVWNEPDDGWRRALARFVEEHARNAGPTLYRLLFNPAADVPTEPPRRHTVAEVRADPEGWLTEGAPVLVTR
jgi:hypothetical protein